MAVEILTTFVMMSGLLLFLRYDTADADAKSWDYANDSDHGPDRWKDYYPDCGGVMQSPIDLNTSHLLYDPGLKFFDTSDYSKTDGVSMFLQNVGGHTAEVKYSGSPVYLRGGSLPDLYEVDQFHFHWGLKDWRGSEHSLNGYFSPMEMHIVHHQVHLGNISSAMTHPHGLAVLGFFIKVGKENPGFKHILDYFGNISKPGKEIKIPTFQLSELLPKKTNLHYFRYMGSLTTPPCYETVIWSLSVDAIEISHEQFSKFRGLYDEYSKPLVDDFRPVQDRHSRMVSATFMQESALGRADRIQTLSSVSVTMTGMLSTVLLLWRIS